MSFLFKAKCFLIISVKHADDFCNCSNTAHFNVCVSEKQYFFLFEVTFFETTTKMENGKKNKMEKLCLFGMFALK